MIRQTVLALPLTLSRWVCLRPLVEWWFLRLGKGPAPVEYVDMTDERRYCLERQGQGGAR